MTILQYRYKHLNIQHLVKLFLDRQLNLEPSFQRSSVWRLGDRKRLIESIFQNYPVPSIFLYRRIDEKGHIVYDVIDGKQRLETILMFQGLGKYRGRRFSVRMQLDPSGHITDDPREKADDWDWQKLQRKKLSHCLFGYEVQTVEIDGAFDVINDLFVRINSTGKQLTSAEKRHAKYLRSSFLVKAGSLARKLEKYFERNGVLSSGQISRMKHIELVCEMMASIYAHEPINKKKALDDIIGGQAIDGRSLQRCLTECERTLRLVERIFPDLSTTRFSQVADFYSLSFLIWEMDTQGYILNDKKRNQQAQKLLVWLSNGVDLVRGQIRRAEGAKSDQRLFADYLFTVQGDTDSQSTRKRRADILYQILGGLFEEKDSQRRFTPEQRRLIWHSDEDKKCKSCKKPLTWNNFTIDHIKPHSGGGRTQLTNAALMCRICNSKKGARQL